MITKDKNAGDEFRQLREQAEKTLEGQKADTREPSELSTEATRRLIHDLQVHQIELEMQNEELRRAQLELEEERDKYSDLYDFAPVGYFTISEKGVILDANLTMCTMSGVERGLLTGSPFSKFINRDDQAIFYYHRRKLIETNTKQTYELRIVNKDKSQFHAQMECIPVLDEDGNICRIRAAVTNIADRKQAEEALRKAHDELERRVEERTAKLVKMNEQLEIEIEERKKAEKALQESNANLDKAQAMAHIGSWRRDLNMDQGNWSDEMYRILGLSPGDPENPSREDFLSRVHPADRERTVSVLKKAVEKKRSFDFEFRTIPIEGLERIVHSQGEVVCDETETPVILIGTNLDITERRKLEEERLKREKLESLGVLAGGLAHNFNNILTVIMGNVYLAKQDVARDSEAHEVLQEAEKEIYRAKDLTLQLLTFARGGAPVKETASLAEVVRGSGGFVLKGSNVRCDFTIPEDIWPIEIDVGQISQVVQNLIINADQAMPDGGVIEIDIENRVIEAKDTLPIPSGKYVRVTVKDKGIGIQEKHLPKIFDPYFSTKDRGSGLGLATAYSIIEKHGGHITVDSRFGVGTVFHFYLPASEKEMGEAKAMEGELIRGDSRVLVMDDEETLRNLACQVLERVGYHVELAKDGEEAIAKYIKAMKEGEPFDAVILDLTIPGGMGGKETIGRLKEIDPKVKAMVASGYSNDPVMANFRDYGFSGVVSKPFGVNKLGRALHDMIDMKDN